MLKGVSPFLSPELLSLLWRLRITHLVPHT